LKQIFIISKKKWNFRAVTAILFAEASRFYENFLLT
jgi:hypothetical protein